MFPPTGVAARPVWAAVGWAVIASLAIAVTHAVMRAAAADLHPFLVAFWRNAISLLLISPFVVAGASWRATRPALGRHALRGAVNAAAMILLIFGLSRAPFAYATALSFAAAPFAVLGAMVFLRERPDPKRLVAAVLGFVGVLVILDPMRDGIAPGGVYILGAAILFGAVIVIGKSQTRYASNMSILLYLYVFLTFFCLLAALTVWRWPTADEFVLLVALGALAVIAHYAMIAALRAGDASLVAPFDYLRLVWAAGIGVALFGESVEPQTLVGAAVIVAATLWPALRPDHRA